MKKVFFLLLCFLLPLTGCVIIEEDFPELMETDTQTYDKLQDLTHTFTFKSLTGEEEEKELTIGRNSEDTNKLEISPADYDQKFLVVVLLKTDCEKSKSLAPYLNEQATRISPKMHGLNYVPVFLDIYEDSPNTDIPWISELSNIDFFMNAFSVCAENGCHSDYLPLGPEAATANIYVVDTNNIIKTKKVYSWNLTEDPQLQAKKMESALATALGLEEISFDVTVDDWNTVDSEVSF